MAGICDACGGSLEQRADDTVETVSKRMKSKFYCERENPSKVETFCTHLISRSLSHQLTVYEAETAPLAAHYATEGLLTDFRITKGKKDTPAILKVLEAELSERWK